jgi:hypothetical protein
VHVAREQDADGVTAVVRDLESGTESSVRAKYVVAADGNRSPIRERLGIGMHGHGLLSHSITIYFRALADLGPLLKGRNLGVHYVTNPLMRGFFRLDRSGNAGFLVVNLVGDTSRPEVIAAFPSAPCVNVAEGITEQRALELLRAAIGVPDIGVVIENIATWRAEANCADRFGDDGCSWPVTPRTWSRRMAATAATRACRTRTTWPGSWRSHWPAWPGLGCWIRMTPNGSRSGSLPLSRLSPRYVTRVAPYLGTEHTQPMVDDFSMEIGYRYDSLAVVLEPGGPPLYEHPRESAGRPGARAPHIFLDRDGTRLSRLDLFGRNFVLLAGPEGAAWPAAALAVADRLGVGLDAYVVGGTGLADPEGCFPGRTGSRRPGPCWYDRMASWAGGPPKRPARPNRLSGRRSDAAVPGRQQAMNSESGRRKKVHSWHTCIARTPWGRSCARST